MFRIVKVFGQSARIQMKESKRDSNSKFFSDLQLINTIVLELISLSGIILTSDGKLSTLLNKSDKFFQHFNFTHHLSKHCCSSFGKTIITVSIRRSQLNSLLYGKLAELFWFYWSAK